MARDRNKSKVRSTGTRDDSLFTYKMNSKNTKVYTNICDYCGKPFEFQMKDVKDRILKCPNCNADLVFFAYEYL